MNPEYIPRIPRKWEFIASHLERMNAPKKIIDAARSIDETLVGLGLSWNTHEWELEMASRKEKGSLSIDMDTLWSIANTAEFCSACADCNSECDCCLLGIKWKCTPRSRYPDNWMKMVLAWLERMS